MTKFNTGKNACATKSLFSLPAAKIVQPIAYLGLWGGMASCGRLEIGLLLISRKLRQAD
jgi:hypothetical protein